MQDPGQVSIFSKSLLAGALTGLVATIINIIYDVAFRGITKYYPAEEFNFFSITLASMIVLSLTGMLFFVFKKYFNELAFDVTLILIAIACVAITAFVGRYKNESIFYGNHGLIAGFVLISGILALTLMPYLYKHPKIFI